MPLDLDLDSNDLRLKLSESAAALAPLPSEIHYLALIYRIRIPKSPSRSPIQAKETKDDTRS